jgi:hypothetical protein
MLKIAEVKLSNCGLKKKLQLRNGGIAVKEQHFLLQVAELQLRTQKKLLLPTWDT